jgi:hypothetical protein
MTNKGARSNLMCVITLFLRLMTVASSRFRCELADESGEAFTDMLLSEKPVAISQHGALPDSE